MVDVLTKIRIECPLDIVSSYAANPDHAPEWYANIQSVEWRTPKPLAVGSQIAFTAQFLGRHLEYVYQIIEYTPGEKLVMRNVDGPFPMETIYAWEAIDGHSTLMTLRNKGNPTGFSRIFAPFMSLAIKSANTKDLQKLKHILEKQSGHSA